MKKISYFFIFSIGILMIQCSSKNGSSNVPEPIAEITLTAWYQDTDGDSYGNATINQQANSQPSGYVANTEDCNDSDPTIHPGVIEIAGNDVDENCDGTLAAAEDAPATTANADASTVWYQDADNDTYGNPTVTQSENTQPTGYVNNASDCDDSNTVIHPGAIETTENGVDEDCDGIDGSSATASKTTESGDNVGVVSSQSELGLASDSSETTGIETQLSNNTWSSAPLSEISTQSSQSSGGNTLSAENLANSDLSRTWSGSVWWNGSSLTYDTDCDASGQYNMNLYNLSAILNTDSVSDELSNTGGHRNALGVSYTSSAVMTNRDVDGRYQNYMTGVVGNTQYLSFFSSTIDMSNTSTDSSGETSLTEEIDLTEHGYTTSSLRGKEAFAILQGFRYDNDTQFEDKDASIRVWVDSETSLSASSGRLTLHALSKFRGADTNPKGDPYLYYTIVVYDPNFVSVTNFGNSDDGDFSVADSHSLETNKNVTVNADFALPASFSSTENALGFVGLSGWGQNASSDSIQVHRVKSRVQLTNWDKVSSTSGIATVNISGGNSRYECGTKSNKNLAPNATRGFIVLCKNSNVCKGTFTYESESADEERSGVIWVEDLGS